MRTVNDKIQWTSYSSFVIITSVACVQTVNGNFTVCNMLLITRAILKMASNARTVTEVDEVREERLRRRRERDRLRRGRETNEEFHVMSDEGHWLIIIV